MDEFEEFFKSLGMLDYDKDDKDIEKEAEQRLPKVLEAKKVKFLKAINKSDVGNSNVEGDADDEQFVLEHLYDEIPSLKLFSFKVNDRLIFCDSIVTTTFKQLKRPEFDLKKYIVSVKCIYANYLELKSDPLVMEFSLSDTIAYVLAFARDFNNPSNNLFDFSEDGSKELSCADDTELLSKEFTGNTIYIKKLNKLIADLLACYSEQKYQLLNLNVTYIILLMLRRVVKTDKEFFNSLQNDKTHSDYWELCPLPLDYRLPMITHENNKHLHQELRQRDNIAMLMVLYQFNICSGRTRRVFRATCMRHMEYNGLGLPALFIKVAKLYKVDEGKLWDVMSFQACGGGLIFLSDLYSSQAAGKNELPPKTYNLFPYCRVLNSYYHNDMSANHYMNVELCYVLAYLVDLKLGLDVSSARLAHWTNSVQCKKWKSSGKVIAAAAREALEAP